MPIEQKEDQTIVHCTGDVLVLPFSPLQKPCKGTAWLLLQEREPGAIGREPPPQQAYEEMCLNGQPGVLIAANDYRSLDVIIDALKSLRNDLESLEISERQDRGIIPRRVEVYRGEDDKVFVAGLQLQTIRTYDVKGRGTIHICEWPKDVKPFSIAGRIILLDGDLMEVRSVETVGGLKPGQEFGVIVKPFKKRVDDGLS